MRWDESGHKSLANVHPLEAEHKLYPASSPSTSSEDEDDEFSGLFGVACGRQCLC